MTTFFVIALLFLLFCGVVSLLSVRYPALSAYAGAAGPLCVFLVLVPLCIRTTVLGLDIRVSHAWQVPLGSISLHLDALAAFFMLPVLILCGCAAFYGLGYLKIGSDSFRKGVNWFWLNVFECGMLLLLLADNGILFLYAWEGMSIAAFFLICYDHERESVRRAAWIYLIATQIGTFGVLVTFLILGWGSGSMDFQAMAASAKSPLLISSAFILAVLGFGSKAGIMPLHVWLPEAHPAAPSHVSAIMSGAMIKMGIYGILRVLSILGAGPIWWGQGLVVIGGISGVVGILFALSQGDLKRLLAYSSIENVGIVTIGIGVGLIGVSTSSPSVAALGFGGAVLHVLNHSLFKGLLFLGAGSVLHETGTVEMDKLGGLSKRMPWTTACFGIGSASICALPPLNGFVSEFMIYLAAIRLITAGHGAAAMTGVAAVVLLGLIGGLAVVSFTKAVGITFLGEPRSDYARKAKEASWLLRVPMLVLVAGCVVTAFAGALIIASLSTVVAVGFPSVSLAAAQEVLLECSGIIGSITVSSAVLFGVLGLLLLTRRLLPRGGCSETGPTWGCGYLGATPRMQYSASSYSQPLTRFFFALLRSIRGGSLPDKELFPSRADFILRTPDLLMRFVLVPLVSWLKTVCLWARCLQNGHLQWYILYIAVTLIIVLIWKLA